MTDEARKHVDSLLRYVEVEAERTANAKVKVIAFDVADFVISPKEVLTVIAQAIDMQYADYKKKCKERAYADLRKLACALIKHVFPELSHNELARYLGWGEHSSVTSALIQCSRLLETRDMNFVYKYNAAVQAIEAYSYKRIVKHPLSLNNEDTKAQDQA